MSVVETTQGLTAPGTGGAPAPTKNKEAFGEDGFTFRDFIDIINPLQHLPLISTLYRHLTGDTIDPGAKVAGDCLFGGPLGYLGYVFSTAVSDTTGKDPGEHLLALFIGDEKQPASDTQLAETPAEARFDTAAGSVETLSPTAATEPYDDDEQTKFARLFAEARRESDRLAHERIPDKSLIPTARGALAPEGGWFTDVMLSALERYQVAAKLTAAGGGTPQSAGASAGMRFDASY